MFADILSNVSPRQELIDGLLRLVHKYHLVLIRGTLASGKTTIMKLVANAFLEKNPHTPVHIISGWNKKKVAANEGWSHYLKKLTGIYGVKWPTTPAFLLFDECQQSYWDEDLWSWFRIDTSRRPRILEESTLHILLKHEEASDMMKRHVRAIGPPMSKDLMDRLYVISEGHAGCLAALMVALGQAEVSFSHIPILEYYHVAKKTTPQWRTPPYLLSEFPHCGKLESYI